MRLPFGTNDVTLYHIVPGGVRRVYLRSCSWHASSARTLYDGMMRLKTSTDCSCRWPAGQQAARMGDLLVLGHVPDTATSTAQFAGIAEKYAGRAFLCETCSDGTLTGAPLGHLWAKGAAYGS